MTLSQRMTLSSAHECESRSSNAFSEHGLSEWQTYLNAHTQRADKISSDTTAFAGAVSPALTH
jgi:hypothetical protein